MLLKMGLIMNLLTSSTLERSIQRVDIYVYKYLSPLDF